MRHAIHAASIALLAFLPVQLASGQAKPRALAAVWAHADDEVVVGPVLARYAREGADVYMIIATDGAQGGGQSAR